MQKVSVVTSCSADGWDKYGRKFVETFIQYWPKSVALYVVSEDPLPLLELPKCDDREVYGLSLERSLPWQTFRGNNSERKWVHGDGGSPRPQGCAVRWTATSGYSFRHDAYKFSKKVFAIELAASMVVSGRLLWIDADALTFAPVPEDLPVRVLPPSSALSCLCRVGYHSECGFVGYNLDHAETVRFIQSFVGLYTTEEVFNLAEWHDSWVFDWLRNKLMTSTYPIPHKSKGHPFINSELGRYMDHLKGSRKMRGKSQVVEQIANRTVPYWQGV